MKPAEFNQRIWYGNINRLCIWSSIGQDVENGIWAIYGTRMGASLALLTEHDHSVISDYDAMQEMWETTRNDDPLAGAIEVGKRLKQKVGLDIALLAEDESRFFKRVYMNPPRPWMPELDISHFMALRHV